MYLQEVIKGTAAAVLERTGVDVMTAAKDRYHVIVRTIFFHCVIDKLKITQTALSDVLGNYKARPTITYALGRWRDWQRYPKIYKTELFWAETLAPIIIKELDNQINAYI